MKSIFFFVFIFIFPVCIFSQDAKLTAGVVSVEKRGAFDSLNLHSAVSGNEYITFPNAFRWNHSGPTGGRWNDSNVDDYVFRPVFKGVAGYRLEIYTRKGNLVFQSNDLYKGWDGYLKDRTLASQGVYVWKVTGKFNDGSWFRKIGDVTFLY
ncbi:MAG TPA: gliding motility-associated C-terminal domain-containing protein [Bacteroidales bacterium]|nr:gliding motility-associated C-terminal domain-containing protein [Bacteroidales bacterium]